ncbi:MAG: CocE/NonD family hydrolase [Chloroflexota bacterium]|nr:CocE/NonD family hydrolase [Chloroflexota bacterium]
MIIDWDVPIVASDGETLRADVFRPDGNEPHPVLLGLGPYAKGLPFQEGYPDQWGRLVGAHPEVMVGSSGAYQNWEVPDPEKWVPDGYVCVRVDARGTGRSPGYLQPFAPREVRDLYEAIEWAAAQPWSTGKVGLSGVSYFAINAWLVAGLGPPHLAAMIPWEGAADWYRDMTHHGGLLSTFWEHWFDKQVLPIQHGMGDRSPVNPHTGDHVAGPATLDDAQREANRCDLGDEIRAHPLDDAYHRERSADWSNVRVPFLSASNWGGVGLHSRGNFEAFTEATSSDKWLEVHGNEHWTEYYTDYGLDLQRRFLARFLKGDQGAWPDDPRVRLQVRAVDGFRERAENEWPLARTNWTDLYLDATGLALTSTARVDDGHLEYDPGGDGLTFQAEPVTQETEITGPLAATLFVSSAKADADVFVVLRAFAPDGSEVVFQGALDPHTPLSQGWLRASHRGLDPARSRLHRPFHPHDRVEPLVPGEIYELVLEIWPTSIVLPAGYRLALTIRGVDYVYPGPTEEIRLTTFKNALTGSGPFLHDDPFDRPADALDGQVTIWTGPRWPSRLLVPVIPS